MGRITKARQTEIDASNLEIQKFKFKESWDQEFTKFIDKLNSCKKNGKNYFRTNIEIINGVASFKMVELLSGYEWTFPVFPDKFISFQEIHEFYDALDALTAVERIISQLQEEARKLELRNNLLKKLHETFTKEERDLILKMGEN